MKTIKVAIYRVGMEMEILDIKKKLKEYQGIVGGLITEATLADNLALICNDNGINEGLMVNRTYRFFNGELGVAFGDFFVCRVEGADYVGLTDEDIQRLPRLIDGILESLVKIYRIARGLDQ